MYRLLTLGTTEFLDDAGSRKESGISSDSVLLTLDLTPWRYPEPTPANLSGWKTSTETSPEVMRSCGSLTTTMREYWGTSPLYKSYGIFAAFNPPDNRPPNPLTPLSELQIDWDAFQDEQDS